jgi:hypothetical protein
MGPQGAERLPRAVSSAGVILIEAPSPAEHRGRLRAAKTLVTNKEKTSRRFSTKQHPFSCGIDLQARTMDVCILDQAGEKLLHRNMQATPEALPAILRQFLEKFLPL